MCIKPASIVIGHFLTVNTCIGKGSSPLRKWSVGSYKTAHRPEAEGPHDIQNGPQCSSKWPKEKSFSCYLFGHYTKISGQTCLRQWCRPRPYCIGDHSPTKLNNFPIYGFSWLVAYWVVLVHICAVCWPVLLRKNVMIIWFTDVRDERVYLHYFAKRLVTSNRSSLIQSN